MDITLSYGVLPSREQFEEQYKLRLGYDFYRIRNCKLVGDVDYSCNDLWNRIKKFHDATYASNASKTNHVSIEKCDEYLDWISCVLGTLGIEWI